MKPTCLLLLACLAAQAHCRWPFGPAAEQETHLPPGIGVLTADRENLPSSAIDFVGPTAIEPSTIAVDYSMPPPLPIKDKPMGRIKTMKEEVMTTTCKTVHMPVMVETMAPEIPVTEMAPPEVIPAEMEPPIVMTETAVPDIIMETIPEVPVGEVETIPEVIIETFPEVPQPVPEMTETMMMPPEVIETMPTEIIATEEEIPTKEPEVIEETSTTEIPVEETPAEEPEVMEETFTAEIPEVVTPTLPMEEPIPEETPVPEVIEETMTEAPMVPVETIAPEMPPVISPPPPMPEIPVEKPEVPEMPEEMPEPEQMPMPERPMRVLGQVRCVCYHESDGMSVKVDMDCLSRNTLYYPPRPRAMGSMMDSMDDEL